MNLQTSGKMLSRECEPVFRPVFPEQVEDRLRALTT
jgi:hypothetical protein